MQGSTRSRSSARGLALTVVLLLGLLAACGSSDDDDSDAGAGSSTTAGSDTSSEPVRGVTDTEIVVGGAATKSNFPGLDAAAKARFDEANRNGEIPGGRKIRYVEATDDQGTNTGALAGVQRQVEQSHVFAIVPGISIYLDKGGVTYLNENKVPYIGWGINSGHCTSDPENSWFFSFSGCLVPNQNPDDPYSAQTAEGTKALLKELGTDSASPTIGIICEDYAASQGACITSSATYKQAGFEVVYSKAALPLPVASDFTPFVQALMTADGGDPPDVINMPIGVQNALGLSKALKQAGYEGAIMNIFYAPQLTAAQEGVYATQAWATPESDAPAMKKIVKTLTDAGVTTIGIGELASYFSADYFVTLLKKIGPDLTLEKLHDAASDITYGIKDVVGPTHYPAGFLVGPSCGSIVTSDGKAWSVVVPFTCYPVTLKKEGDKYVEVDYPDDIE